MSDMLRDAFEAALESLRVNEPELGRLDAVAGDGDHGRGMVRGFAAAVSALGQSAGAQIPAGPRLRDAGSALSDAAGGASGALWGAMLYAAGSSLKDASAADDALAVSAAIEAALDAVRKLGRAEVGDRTLVDALQPFSAEFAKQVTNGTPVTDSWEIALRAAEAGAAATAGLSARRGRAAALADRCKGHVDAGARSLCIVLAAAQSILIQGEGPADG